MKMKKDIKRCLYPCCGFDFEAPLKLPFIKEWIYVDDKGLDTEESKIAFKKASEDYGFNFVGDNPLPLICTMKFIKDDVTLYFIYNTIFPDNLYLNRLLLKTGYIYISGHVPSFDIGLVTPNLHTLFLNTPSIPDCCGKSKDIITYLYENYYEGLKYVNVSENTIFESEDDLIYCDNLLDCQYQRIKQGTTKDEVSYLPNHNVRKEGWSNILVDTFSGWDGNGSHVKHHTRRRPKSRRSKKKKSRRSKKKLSRRI
jgi:hypothetical protein